MKGNYYPIKPEGNIYAINSEIYSKTVWALNWEDVNIFVRKNERFVAGILPVSSSTLMPDKSLIILASKDGREDGNFSLEVFGGWLEVVPETELDKVIREHIAVMKERIGTNKEWYKQWENNRVKQLKDLYEQSCRMGGGIVGVKQNIKNLESKGTNISNIVCYSFYWGNTPEGVGYWKGIDDNNG